MLQAALNERSRTVVHDRLPVLGRHLSGLPGTIILFSDALCMPPRDFDHSKDKQHYCFYLTWERETILTPIKHENIIFRIWTYWDPRDRFLFGMLDHPGTNIFQEVDLLGYLQQFFLL